MKFKDKYCLEKDKDKIENKDKTDISDNFYALCETIENATDKLIRSKHD